MIPATTRVALLRASVLLVLVAAACATPEPQPITYGVDQCDYCRMTITDERYGAELVTRTGLVRRFDSPECLAAYTHEHPEEEVHSRWVTDFRRPPRLIRVEEAYFLHSPNLRSPMGLNLTAFGEAIEQEAVLNSFGGEILSWDGVLGLVGREWIESGTGPSMHGPGAMPAYAH